LKLIFEYLCTIKIEYKIKYVMEAVRITAQGQITIPIGIRKKLNLKAGDKVIFIEERDGRIFFENPALLAFNQIQNVVCHFDG